MTMRWAAGALVIAGLALGSIADDAQAAQAPAPSSVQAPTALTPPYPDAGDPTALGRWFGQTTHLPAKSILAITDHAIFAAFPHHASGPFWTVDVRLESITPQTTAKLGGRSIRLRLNVRCDTNSVRLMFMDIYPGADLTGAPTHREPPNSWASPKPNSYVSDAVRLACDKTFQGPFAALLAGATEHKAEPPPAPAPPPAAQSPGRAPDANAQKARVAAYAAQIGAYSTPGQSQSAWQALKAAKPELTRGLKSATTAVEVGPRVLYRTIVTGFTSAEAATTFCQTLRTSGRPCLIVTAGATP